MMPVISRKRFSALLLSTLSLGNVVPQLHAAVTFPDVFAPENGYIHPSEKPFRQELCLNGSWQFQPVSLPDGFKEGQDPVPALPPVDPGHWDSTPIRIPSPWNVNAFTERNGTQDGGDFHTFPSYPKTWEKIKLGWLRKTFTVPADWQQGRRLFLHFDAVAGNAEVLVNGKPAGSHFDIFLPFDLDVTDAVRFGAENELLVGVRKASLFDQKSDHGRRTYQGGSFWGQFAAGIWQDVFLVAEPAVRAANIYIEPRVDTDTLAVHVTLANDADREMAVSVDAKVFPWIAPARKSIVADPVPSTQLGAQAALSLPAAPVKIPAHGRAEVDLQGPVKGALKPWDPKSPNLYGLVVSTGAGGAAVDASYTRFGWRQLTFRGAELLLNGQPITLRGDSWHFMGIPQMSRRYAWAWFTALHDAGLNAVRLHAEPYPSFYLDVADEMGIMVLDETAMWASDGGPKLDSPAYWKDSEAHLSSLVLRDRNHPAVFGWSVSNEIVPIVRGVMRNPPGMLDELLRHYTVWAGICRRLDPSRPWISADGEDDGQGRLPTYVVHYGGTDAQKRAAASGKPWGVGEAGNAYYGTPEQVAQQAGGNYERAYDSFAGRMEGVAISSYDNLMGQRDNHAVYRSVFNLAWYGLEPLTLGMKDTTRPPSSEDGVRFSSFKEGQPGVQPERLGPYCTTLNPGYDPSLPLYKPWPLFEAIKDAAAEPPVKGKWASVPAASAPLPAAQARPVTKLEVLAAAGGQLAAQLKAIGVPLNPNSAGGLPEVLFIDGAHPPGGDAGARVNQVLGSGGTVLVWDAEPAALGALNALLPAPIELTDRKTSSLLPVTPDPLIAGLSPGAMYFSEQRPAEIATHGLAGPLAAHGKVLLKANDTDWQRWNKQPEETKTGMILRSERESKPSGAVLVSIPSPNGGTGRLILTTLPAAPRSIKAEKLDRALLANLGIALGTGMDAGKPLLKNGNLVRALASGYFSVPNVQDGAKIDAVKPAAGESIRANTEAAEGRKWKPLFQENGIIDMTKLGLSGPQQNAEAYLSFWVFSPRSLEDLLLEPNLPSVGFETSQNDAVQAWLNGQQIINKVRTGPSEGGKAAAEGLKLRQGWNHVLVKLIHQGGGWEFSGRFTCSQPEFLGQMDSALEKP